jgi:4-alpha-glucanotransferase
VTASTHTHEALAELTSLYHVQTGYWDAGGTHRHPSDEALTAVLATLGAQVSGPGDLADALRERRREIWNRLAEPVATVEAGSALELSLRVPGWATGQARATLALEDGSETDHAFELGELPVVSSANVDGEDRRELRLRLPEAVPPGYHSLRIETGGVPAEVLVISAPRTAPAPARPRGFGVFLPLYALRTTRTMGIADLGDAEALLATVDELGGDLVGSTPLLASFAHEPSPYAPASRLFWNELYADLEASPELAGSPSARALLESPEFRATGRTLAELPYVDYPAAQALRRPVLEELAGALYATPSARRDALEAHLRTHPQLADYARFRATAEARGTGWPVWPAAERDGKLRVADDDPSYRYHVYGQWLVDQQLEQIAHRDGAGLYLDLPLGVHVDSYDTWRERTSFALGASGGAPPDQFFAEGQEWGFPPMHPEGIRRERHRYPIACLRRMLSRARALRIDHVMGLHRLFWVPRGFPATDGVYVGYPADELYAIVCLEAHRHGTMVVGEDLGTVPDEVRETMEQRGVRRSYVLQFSLRADEHAPMEHPPTASLASVNTHDTPPFAAFWRDADPALRGALVGYLRTHGRLPEGGEPDAVSVVRACLDELAAGNAETLLVNVEDLWGELEPQNVPGTSGEGARNWGRRARYSLEQMHPALREALGHLDGLRQEGAAA